MVSSSYQRKSLEGPGMARRSQYVMSAAVAGACLTVAACGASAAPGAASGSPSAKATTSTGASLTGDFCNDASSFMRHIPSDPTTKDASATQARANLRKVLRDTVKGFSGLESEAPKKLDKSLRKIVDVYKRDEKVVDHGATLATISQSMVRGNASGSAAFQHLLKYISVTCK